MTGPLTALFLLGSAGLGAWVWSELNRPHSFGEAATAGAPRALPAMREAAAGDNGQRRRDEVASVLARPVFSTSRRPRDVAARPVAAAPATILPRMTAILIDGRSKSAIFEGTGKPTILSEGGHIGPFVIQRIEPQQVTIIGPDGKRLVHTSFATTPTTLPPPPTGLADARVAPPARVPPGAAAVGLPGPGGPGLPNLGTPR